jgi:hypothetical protein
VLAAAGHCRVLLLLLLRLAAAGHCWLLLAPAAAATGYCCWPLLAAAGCWLLLLQLAIADGHCWPLQATAGCCSVTVRVQFPRESLAGCVLQIRQPSKCWLLLVDDGNCWILQCTCTACHCLPSLPLLVPADLQ